MGTMWRTRSEQETIRRGRFIARSLQPGTVVALVGDLGSGKTTLVKGLALGLGIQDSRQVKSPTFVILHVYKGRIPLYHFDLYRLDNQSDLEGIGIEEFLSDSKAISVIEWADRVPAVLNRADMKIEFRTDSEKTRTIRMTRRSTQRIVSKTKV